MGSSSMVSLGMINHTGRSEKVQSICLLQLPFRQWTVTFLRVNGKMTRHADLASIIMQMDRGIPSRRVDDVSNRISDMKVNG